MVPKTYDVVVNLRFRIETRMPTEGDVQASVRELVDSLGFGGVLSVIAIEEGSW